MGIGGANKKSGEKQRKELIALKRVVRFHEQK
jgi:hypothetical protein